MFFKKMVMSFFVPETCFFFFVNFHEKSVPTKSDAKIFFWIGFGFLNS